MLLVCYLVILESCTTSLNVFVVGNVGDKTCTSNQVGISRLVEIKDMGYLIIKLCSMVKMPMMKMKKTKTIRQRTSLRSRWLEVETMRS